MNSADFDVSYISSSEENDKGKRIVVGDLADSVIRVYLHDINPEIQAEGFIIKSIGNATLIATLRK